MPHSTPRARILLPRTQEADALARELQDYEIRVSEDANDRYRAFRVGAHDDSRLEAMATRDASPDVYASERLDHAQRLQECFHTLRWRG